jgi:hypothetical protein
MQIKAKFRYKWHGPKVRRSLDTGARLGVKKAADWLRGYVVRSLSKSSRPQSMQGGVYPQQRKRDSRGRFLKGTETTPAKGAPMKQEHSKPGEPPRSNTGEGRRSIFSSSHNSKPIASVGTTKKYMAFLEKGTKGGTIVAVRKKSLVFPGKVYKNGKVEWGWVFVKRVKHPGIKARPFLRPALKKNKRKLHIMITKQIQRHMIGRTTAKWHRSTR